MRGAPLIAALLVVGAFALPCSAPAELVIGGHLKAFWFQQLAEPYELDRVGARLQLSASGGVGSLVSYFGAVDFELDSRLFETDQPATRGEGFDIYPVELWIQLSAGPIELKVGQQYIFWGKGAWVSPTDVLTPWNYPDMASEIEDYRTAPLATRLGIYPGAGDLLIDLIWIPLVRGSRFGAGGPTEMGGLPVTVVEAEEPGRGIQDSEFGLRLSHSVSSWAFDWSVSGYRGFEKMPVMSFAPITDPRSGSPAPTGFALKRRYDPIWMVGLDLAKALGPVVIEAEAALKLTEDADGDDPTVRNSRVEAVAGLSWTIIDELEVGVRYQTTARLAYAADDERAALLAATGSTPPFVEEAWTHAVTLQIRADFTDELHAQVIGVFDATYVDFFVMGFVSWDIADALRLAVGAVGFGGKDSSTPHGAMGSNSRAFVELKQAF